MEKYVAPPLTWRTAAQDAKAGIYYTKDEFPSSSFLPPPFSREPVQVHGGERVELLQEVDEYAVRVRVLRTGMTGLIPAWNTEGALDRLTRINTAFNEAVRQSRVHVLTASNFGSLQATCPTEARALRRRFSESAAVSHNSEDTHYPSPTPSADPSLAHVHSRCISFATRVRFGDFYANPSAFEDSSSSDSDDPDTPQSPSEPDAASRGRKLLYAEPGVYRAPSRTLEGGISARAQSAARKSVVFPKTERPQVVFRYPSEELVEVLHEEKREGSVEEEDEDDEEWWWHGWEEPLEESDSDSDAAEEEERGRAREAKIGGTDAMQGVVDQDGVPRWLVAIQEEQ